MMLRRFMKQFTDQNWFVVGLIGTIAQFGISALPTAAQETSATNEEYEKRDNAVTGNDLSIIRQAREIIAEQRMWHQQDNKKCPDTAVQFSLFCALYKASIEVLGEYDCRRGALQEVRFAIMDVSDGVQFEHRLMEFNNRSETYFKDIHHVLDIAEERMAERLKKEWLRDFSLPDIQN